MTVCLERPDVLERGRVVRAPVRPGVRLVGDTVEVQVTVLEPVGEAFVGARNRRGRHAVHQYRPRSLLEAGTVGILAIHTAGRVIGRTGYRAGRALGLGVLAYGAGARSFSGGVGIRSAHAGVEDVRVAERLATRVADVDRVL